MKFALALVAFVSLIAATGEPRVRADEPACPPEMVLVDGDYCPNVQVSCIDWMDPENAAARRCRQYGPSTCHVALVHKSFCMARTEHTEVDSRLPMTGVDYYQADAICKQEGFRLCFESEFEQACSGKEFSPYPTGQTRRCDLCNCDVHENIGTPEHRVDHRKTVDEVAGCVSSYGVSGLTGNVDEIFVRDVSPGPYKVVLKGGHFLPVRNRCISAATTAHSELYSSTTTLGFRCCAYPKRTE
jgi:sulfatase modifying factor 1